MRQLPTTSIELALVSDMAIAQRDEQFPSGLNSNLLAVSARLGVNYYFSPGQSRTKEATAQP
jgi:hypothetical protein